MIELLKGEKDLNTIATENNIQPNLLRNWKKEFLDKASVVFDDTREDNLKEKLALERKEKAEYAKKVGLLTKRWFIILRQKKRIKKYQKGRVKNFRLFHTPFFYLFISILHPRSVHSRLPQLLQAGHTFHSEDVRHVLLPNGK